MMLKFLRAQLAELLTKRSALVAERDKIVTDAEARGANALTADEDAAFEAKRSEIAAIDEQRTALEARISGLEADEKREADAAEAYKRTGQTGERRSGGATVTREPRTYERGNGRSYFLDMARMQLRGDQDAIQRLQRHGKELDVDMPARAEARERRAHSQLDGVRDLNAEQRGSVFEKRTNPNRTDGQGGYFVPPLWLVDQYIDLPRFGRTTANLCRGFDLPAGTDSINMPKVSTGTAAAVQTADAASVTSTDLTDTSVNAPVRTIAGQQDIALQLLDQSPINFDEVVFADLIADLNAKLDVQVINGSGSSGQCTGILNVSSINSVTYTDASPTLAELYVPLVQSASLIEKNRKLPATGAVMIPSMWYWATGQLDSSSRPLIVQPGVAYNPAAASNGLVAEGSAGMLSFGLPVYTDGNIPSNLGGGTNETRIITARWDDLYLWEGPLRTRVLSEVLSGTLQVRLQVWEYFAFMGNRRPESISVISGTGVIPTSGY
jgi:HK97 family phage major capsid protein